MNRADLLDKLKLAAPALAKSAFMPILNCFWFTGKHVMAHNDQITIAVPFKTDFEGAVEGELLLGLLTNSRAKEATLTPGGENDSHLSLVASSTKAKLGLEPPDAFIMPTPKPNAAKQIRLTKEKEVMDLLNAIDLVMLSVSGDTTIPDQMGITFVPEEGGVGLFSTNHHSMSYSFVKLAKTWPTRVILPALFCQQLRSLGGKRKELGIEVYKDHVLVSIVDVPDAKGKADTDPVLLFTRVLESERPHNFGKVLDTQYTAKVRKQMLPLPAALKLACERAFLVSQDKKEKKPTVFSVADGILAMSTEGVAEVKDRIKLPDHAEVSLSVNVGLLRSVLGSYHSAIETENGRFCITPDCMILNQGESVYLLSEWQKEK